MTGSRFQRIDLATYQDLVSRCTVLEQDVFGEKVLRTPEGLIVKIFRRKRWLTTAMLVPYAQRFVSNAGRLAERGIRTVEIVGQSYCPPLKRHLVTYRPVPGGTLRDRLQALPERMSRHLELAASFIASLHQKGVYFRSLHFGNLIVSGEGDKLGVIDVADMSFRAQPLPVSLRSRNFRHLMRRAEDRALLEQFGCRRFIDSYLAATGLSEAAKTDFVRNLRRHVPALTGDER